jgi:hypothetical protein
VTLALVADAPGPCALPGLAPRLAPEARARLQLLLIRRAASWAVAAAARHAVLLVLGGGGEADVAAVLPRGVTVLRVEGGAGGVAGGTEARAERDARGAAGGVEAAADRGMLRLVRAAAEQAHSGPFVATAIALPRLGPEHVAAAWADLDAGVRVVFGPTLEGGAYLVGLADVAAELDARHGEVLPGLLAPPGGPAGLGSAFETAHGGGDVVGLLRHERALVTPQDVTAFLADPLLDAELRAALTGAPDPGATGAA